MSERKRDKDSDKKGGRKPEPESSEDRFKSAESTETYLTVDTDDDNDESRDYFDVRSSQDTYHSAASIVEQERLPNHRLMASRSHYSMMSPDTSIRRISSNLPGISEEELSDDENEDDDERDESPMNKERLTQSSRPHFAEHDSYDEYFENVDLDERHSRPRRLSATSRQRSVYSISSNKSRQRSIINMLHTNLQAGNVFVYMILPPDGGYGWLILVISFLCQVIVDGIIFSLGIVMPYIADDLGSSPSNIALVASTQIGPITTAFINKYGFRPVAFMGATISICTIFIATFSKSLSMLLFFYSIIGGPSLSMIWISSQLIIGYYFEKYRPIASGVSCSGAGIGVVLFSYMNGVLVEEIGWRNTSRVHVCFLFLVLLMALTYIEVAPTPIGRILETIPDTESDSLEASDIVHTVRYSRPTFHTIDTVSSIDTTAHVNLTDRLVELDTPEESRKGRCFQRCCPSFLIRCFERRPVERTIETKSYVIRHDPLDKQDIFYTGPADYTRNQDPQTTQSDRIDDMELDIEVLPERRSTVRAINYTLSMMNTRQTSSRLSDAEETTREKTTCLDYLNPSKWIHPKIKNAFALLFDFKLLRIMEFQILLASAFFFPMGFNIPFVYAKARAEIDDANKAFISPTIGLSNFFFRVVSGFVAFKYREYTTYICGGGMAFGGLATLWSAFYGANIVWFQFLFAACFGVASAFYSTLRAIIYVRNLGLDKLTNAFGLTAMAMGAGVFIGTSSAGVLNQYTGSYQASFILSGLCMTLSGVLKLILPSMVTWKQNLLLARRTRGVTFAD